MRAWLALGLILAAAAWAIRRVFASSSAVEHDTYQSPTQVRHWMAPPCVVMLLHGVDYIRSANSIHERRQHSI